jgi:putative endonuclease
MRHNTAVGKRGEDLAAGYLEQLGMVVIERNWRCELGEIDLIARESGVLILCEVKTRTSTRKGHPLEAISDRKIRRLRRLALRWLDDASIYAPRLRFDVIGIVLSAHRPPEITHIRGVE